MRLVSDVRGAWSAWRGLITFSWAAIRFSLAFRAMILLSMLSGSGSS